jgi:hypothetical protein
MTDIATAVNGLLDAQLDEIETTRGENEWEKHRRAVIGDIMTSIEDELHQKLKALRDALLQDADRRIAAHDARVQRLNGEEPPAKVLRIEDVLSGKGAKPPGGLASSPRFEKAAE